MKPSKYLEIGFLIVVVALAVKLRTFQLYSPLADWHSWRQADTAAVARNFVKDGMNLLYPQSDSLLALNDKGLENPKRLFINEFPLYNGILALIYKQYGINHVSGRMLSIFISTLGLLALYFLTRKLFNFKVAALAALYYAVNPYNVFYGRVVMPDPTFVALSILSLYSAVLWVESKKWWQGIMLMFFFALAMLVKPYAIFMSIPIFYWTVVNWGFKYTFSKIFHYLVAIGAFLPLILWRLHFNAHPEGSFASSWLLNGDGIRFKGAFFRWIIFDRFNRLIFATGGFVLLVMGVLRSYLNRKSSLIFVWFLAILAYITVFAKGNVNHDYYQLPIMPVGSILVSLGFWWLVDSAKKFYIKVINLGIGVALLLISIAFGYFEVRGFFNINNPAIVEAGQKVDQLTEKDALVVAPYQGDPAFLYQTNRHGWPIGGDVESYVKKGADYYVTTSFDDEFNRLAKKYQVIFKNESYAIINLNKLIPLSQ